jgi:uncharacterized protein (TIGR00661 family)
MRILYGLCGEGMGHAVRSSVVVRHLLSRGHSVQLACSEGRALGALRRDFGHFNVVKIPGLQSVTVRGIVHPELTLARNLLGGLLTSPVNHLMGWLSLKPFDAVISDFDPWTARLAGLTGKPLLAIDNIHFLTRCSHPSWMIGKDLHAAAAMFPVVSGMVPSASRYLVTSIASAPVVKDRTTLHAPILRPEVFALRGAPRENHLVAYFNDRMDADETIRALDATSEDVHVYGMGIDGVVGKVSMRPMGDAFLQDLATSKGCIGGGGFTLMSEAIYLGVPLLSIPIQGQFEQRLNGLYLEAMGYGETCSLGELRNRLGPFLQRGDAYRNRLKGLKHDGNVGLLRDVDIFLGPLPCCS